jgi:thiosulfate/3-mercaptopyruvate sulfurtransferase
MGVNFGQTWVVAYDDSKLAFAARLWWLLRYYGHERVAVLDGGYQHWQHSGLPVSDALPAARAGQFAPHMRTDWIVDIAAVSDTSKSSQQILIDAREADRYAGLVEPIDPVAGHIPGAINYPWTDTTDRQGFLLSAHQHQQRWAALPPDRQKIVYCGSGVTACVNLLSLTLAGITDSSLYPGSWSDWCSYL